MIPLPPRSAGAMPAPNKLPPPIMQPVQNPAENGPSITELLASASQLERSDREAAGRLYFDALQRDPGNLVAHNALERLEDPRRYGAWMRVNCTIHPDDDIYKFIDRDELYSRNPVRDLHQRPVDLFQQLHGIRQ